MVSRISVSMPILPLNSGSNRSSVARQLAAGDVDVVRDAGDTRSATGASTRRWGPRSGSARSARRLAALGIRSSGSLSTQPSWMSRPAIQNVGAMMSGSIVSPLPSEGMDLGEVLVVVVVRLGVLHVDAGGFDEPVDRAGHAVLGGVDVGRPVLEVQRVAAPPPGDGSAAGGAWRGARRVADEPSSSLPPHAESSAGNEMPAHQDAGAGDQLTPRERARPPKGLGTRGFGVVMRNLSGGVVMEESGRCRAWQVQQVAGA